MSISFREDYKMFVLRTARAAYALRIEEDGHLCQAYFGPNLDRDSELLLQHPRDGFSHGPRQMKSEFARLAPRKYREEYPAWGGKFYGEPALKLTFADGTRDCELVYRRHEISADQNKLIITVADEFYALEVDLVYEIYDGLDLISRHSVIRNLTGAPVVIKSAMSATIYTNDHQPCRLSYMTSSWGREYQLHRTMLEGQKIVMDSRTGLPNTDFYPYFALDDGTAQEQTGQVLFGVLHWSGNIKMTVETHHAGYVSVTGGFNDFDFSWKLESGESFDTPVLTLGYSMEGFGGASRMLHDYQRNVLGPAAYRNKPLPALYNSWWAFEFDVHEDQVEPLAAKAAELGVELFVIDDGWFGRRNGEAAGLGDWYPSPEKFPHGLDPIIKTVHDKGMLFGIWVEPEMVNADSDLYRAHPDWVLHFPNRRLEEQRHQLMLNLARPDVLDFVINMLDELLSNHAIDYLKWDMNRFVSQAGWPDAPEGMAQSFWYTHVTNLHKVFRHLKERYPHVILENCASGGLRGDISMTEYCMRMNRSDNQDPRDELFLHEGFTQVLRTMQAGGAGHLGKVPHGINGRAAPLDFRGRIGLMGSLGISIDLRTMSDSDFEGFKKYIKLYKEVRQTVQCGDLYRLVSPRESNMAAFYFAAKDRQEAVLLVFGLNLDFRQAFPKLKLYGLDPDSMYEVEGVGLRSGQLLMTAGLEFDLRGDYDSRMFRIRAVK